MKAADAWLSRSKPTEILPIRRTSSNAVTVDGLVVLLAVTHTLICA